MTQYQPAVIEPKWQKKWEERKVFAATEDPAREKFYALIEFPYPSGDGLHVGHVRSQTALDIVARKKRMEGKNVLYPIGWDAFGLPTENYAIKNKIQPRAATDRNIAIFKRQIKAIGISFDWSREIDTTDPRYYRWTQWIFLQLFRKGLAYRAEMPINWCPACKIGLANEEAVDGKCERCGAATEQRMKKQWMLAITAYAQKLLDGLETVDYIPRVKLSQQNWIGRSEGAEVKFQILNSKFQITVFTTRPDTLFGATFLVLAPEHKLVQSLKCKMQNLDEVEKYISATKNKSDLDRQTEKEKTGVELQGIRAINPVNGEEIPIFIADYILSGYGTGAIMAVPAHDERDWEFAKKYGIEIRRVISGGEENKCWTGGGILVNSDFLDGLSVAAATKKIIGFLEKKNLGARKITYKLRDWVFSRQRYWGEPIPIVHCSKCGAVPLDEKDLPLELPPVESYEPTDTGESPLSKITEWVAAKCPQCGGAAKRETDTMPNWAGSSWYFLRYADPMNSHEFANAQKLKYWGQVDLYNGGMEHTVLHLLYSRFWNQFLHDEGLVPYAEPYARRISHGMILAPDGEKMSKSRGNIVNPDDIVRKYGADTLRVYEMFIGPYDQATLWSAQGVEGARRFLEKVWRLFTEKKLEPKPADDCPSSATPEFKQMLHQTIKKVTEDIDHFSFNTAISQMMIFANFASGLDCLPKAGLEKFLQILSPFAPHLAEELWEKLGNKDLIALQPWPKWNPEMIKKSKITLVVQVNGKRRGELKIAADIGETEVIRLAKENVDVAKWLAGKIIKKDIFVPGKLVNFVVPEK